LKSSIFWNTTPYIVVKVNQRFGGTFRFSLHGRRVSEARIQQETVQQTLLSSETSFEFHQTTQRDMPEEKSS
jgi:hypothetical protein